MTVADAPQSQGAPISAIAHEQDRVAWIRSHMPVLESAAYLNTGTSGPMPDVVAEAISTQMAHELRTGRIGKTYYTAVFALRQRVRESTARVLKATPQEIALTQSTGDGLNLVVGALRWHAGDEVVISDVEHMCLPLALAVPARKYGVQVRVARVGATSAETVEAFASLITPRTRLLAFSHVSYRTGDILPLADLVSLAHAHHIPVLVDGAQTFAAVPLDLPASGVDFYAVPGQKWVCGPEGVGATYVRSSSAELLDPGRLNYYSVRHMDDFGYYVPNPGAARLEGGTSSTPLLAGQAASLDWLYGTVGEEWAYTRTRHMTQALRQELAAISEVTVLTQGNHLTGLTTFQIGKVTPDVIVGQCLAQNVLIRTIDPLSAVRVSTGYFTSDQDIARLVDVVRTLSQS